MLYWNERSMMKDLFTIRQFLQSPNDLNKEYDSRTAWSRFENDFMQSYDSIWRFPDVWINASNVPWFAIYLLLGNWV